MVNISTYFSGYVLIRNYVILLYNRTLVIVLIKTILFSSVKIPLQTHIKCYSKIILIVILITCFQFNIIFQNIVRAKCRQDCAARELLKLLKYNITCCNSCNKTNLDNKLIVSHHITTIYLREMVF